MRHFEILSHSRKSKHVSVFTEETKNTLKNFNRGGKRKKYTKKPNIHLTIHQFS